MRADPRVAGFIRECVRPEMPVRDMISVPKKGTYKIDSSQSLDGELFMSENCIPRGPSELRSPFRFARKLPSRIVQARPINSIERTGRLHPFAGSIEMAEIGARSRTV